MGKNTNFLIYLSLSIKVSYILVNIVLNLIFDDADKSI
jgi:hypothetical protein